MTDCPLPVNYSRYSKISVHYVERISNKTLYEIRCYPVPFLNGGISGQGGFGAAHPTCITRFANAFICRKLIPDSNENETYRLTFWGVRGYSVGEGGFFKGGFAFLAPRLILIHSYEI